MITINGFNGRASVLTGYLSAAVFKVRKLKILLFSSAVRNYGKLLVLLFSSVTISLFREASQATFGLGLTVKNQFVVLWLLLIYLFKLSGRLTISLAVLLIFVCSVFLSFGAAAIADGFSNLAYLLLVVGLLQQLAVLK